MHDVRRERADRPGQATRPDHGEVRHGPVLVEPRVGGEPVREAAEVAERHDMALEPVGGEAFDERADQPFQAAVIQLVHHMNDSEPSRHRPDDRITNPFADSPEGMFSRGTAQRFTRAGANGPPPNASAAV